MKILIKAGSAILVAVLLVFLSCFFGSSFKITHEALHKAINDKKQIDLIEPAVSGMLNREYGSVFSFVHDFKAAINNLNDENRKLQNWDHLIYNDYTFAVTKNSNYGFVSDHRLLLLLLLLFLIVAGSALYIVPKYAFRSPGIHNNHIFFNKLNALGWIGIVLGFLLIVFYILLYFYPEYMTNWVILVDPLSNLTNGHDASQWYLYGFLYTLAILVMGMRMLLKYRGNLYQQVRTASVIFFQTAFAFIIPEILVALNKPWHDFKNIWPLDYTFFYDWRVSNFIAGGTLGWFMLFWGIVLIIVVVPVFTYFFGKRWYCSWVCGCGGLAETLGDPFRQLSNKSLLAWKIERVSVHSVLVLAVIMTSVTLINFFSQYKILGNETQEVHKWYGFLIGSIFSGVVGTGFYPLMGNRMWCRFGCPLAAYIGLVQRFKSRFRITTNGGQCISCGNCSTYCEMGIDVRWYAQRGENIVRSSCVGCGVCAAVCPRGVLRLENAGEKGRFEFHPIA
ncbi:MAG: 4Fe-4S dicluster domain-containing protein [Chitinophagales bacterium]